MLLAGEAFLDAAGKGQQAPPVFHRHVVGQAGPGFQPVGKALIEVVAAQGRVAIGGEHFKHAPGELEDGDVEGAAATSR